jgi:glycosyltransferase involved in cell wall biosynthesis
MVRPNPVEHDTRGCKIANTLAAAGHDVIMVSCLAPDPAARIGTEDVPDPGAFERTRSGSVRVVTVQLTNRARRVQGVRAAARRSASRPLIDPTPRDEYVTQVAELRRRVNDWRDRRHAAPDATIPRAGHLLARAALRARRARWSAQARLDRSRSGAWRAWDTWRTRNTLGAADHRVLPELVDYADSIGPVLDWLRPDILHAHHPTMLPLVFRAARRLRARGTPCQVVYDARENYAGIPVAEQGSARRHAVLVRQEARWIASCAAVFTVSDPIADDLHRRYRLRERPTVLLNVPALKPPSLVGAPRQAEPLTWTVRQAAGLPDGEPLLVYSGAISRARGVETLVDALGRFPDVHLALVCVPFPHPMATELRDRAREVGAEARLHLLAPVPQAELLEFLAGADLAVHPLPSGSPNHDQALPNKLFEYLHAGLDLVVSDARLMAEFVRRHDLGEVFRAGDGEDLARAIRAGLARPRRDPAARRHERAALLARYSWAGQEEALLARYGRLVPVRPAAARETIREPGVDPR